MEIIEHVIAEPGALLGFGDAEWDALSEELGALPIKKRTAAIKQVVAAQKRLPAKQQVTPVRESHRGTSRDEFFKKLPLLDPALRNDILKGVKRLVDHHIFVVKAANITTIKMFEEGDNKKVGENNLTGALLPKNSPFLLDSITLLSGVKPAAPATTANIDFGVIAAEIRNGNHKFYANNDWMISDSHNEVFNTTGTNLKTGMYKLDNTILIASQSVIQFEIEIPALPAADTFVKAILSGSIVVSSKF